jgi:hypothetical protein
VSLLFQRFGNRKIVTPGGSATQEFDRGLQKAFDQLETQITNLTQIVLDIQAAQDAADAADVKARAHMDDLLEIDFTGDYTGTLASNQLPLDIACKRYDGTTNVSSSSTWTRTVESGDVTCTIDAATGVLNITSISTDSVVRVESTRDGLTLRKKQALKVQLTDPPNTGGSGGSSSWTDTTLSSTNSTSMAAISDELTVTVGASGTVSLSAPLSVQTPPNSTSAGVSPIEVYGRWQWWDGAAWQDLGAGETASNPDCDVIYDSESGTYYVSEASLNVSASKTGLVAGASEKFRLEARANTASVTMYYSGTASATTS